MPDVFSADDARHWALLTRAALAARRAEIDALNVFPVPDGDTGTNMFLTLDGALDDVVSAHEARGILGTADLVEECSSLRRAVLMSARGNSGVILSQVVGGLCDVVVEHRLTELDAPLLADCLERGAAKARASVAHPQEGTMLTVADAGAAAARHRADDGGSLGDVAEAAVQAAQDALARTPDQLPVLASAGVVDAGGAGCVLLLESLHRVVTGAWSPTEDGLHSTAPAERRGEWQRSDGGSAPGRPADDVTPDGPAFEVMYLLGGSTQEEVDRLRATLDGLGDSLLVVGGPDLWNVHVHTDAPGAAVEAGILAGSPQRIRITHLPSQVAAREEVVPVGVVAGAAGPGIASLLTKAGAVPIEFAPGRRASASQYLEAARSTGATSVVLLPADHDGMASAEIAAEAGPDDGLDLHVVPARTTVQALAALAVLDPERTVHANVVAMTGAAVSTRHGAVTVATKEALTWAGVCHPGDVLGVVDGDVALLGDDLATSAGDVLDRLLSAGGELVTLVVGADADPALADRVADRLGRERPEVEVVVVEGGQPVYPLLLGVE
ncbi:DAK2 domain-containing protein [Phycicoccus sp. CSK15P-2]|uniref:DAK2 domain-containing protein n=1 Tax=Phycicoccus sp. CSK15P-2 TaxID=2807627 RepID=UPI00194F2C10|nr:DAK2 domain-containing protein [Phycicoccus sp. CSK15P-2]MBM6404791.1 DAK2 domain-containing protein [Phycicoccus sp. CSK15P-2]